MHQTDYTVLRSVCCSFKIHRRPKKHSEGRGISCPFTFVSLRFRVCVCGAARWHKGGKQEGEGCETGRFSEDKPVFILIWGGGGGRGEMMAGGSVMKMCLINCGGFWGFAEQIKVELILFLLSHVRRWSQLLTQVCPVLVTALLTSHLLSLFPPPLIKPASSVSQTTRTQDILQSWWSWNEKLKSRRLTMLLMTR